MAQHFRLGIDLGGTLVKLARVDSQGHARGLLKIKTERDPVLLAKSLAQALKAWPRVSWRGTGVAVAGDVDPKQGVVRFAPNLGWRQLPLGKIFRQAGLPQPLFFDNDATAAAWGAYHAEFHDHINHLVVLTLGTGVGGGLVVEGRLVHGATGSAGEIGHMGVDPRGPRCSCGRRGCLEVYLGGSAMVRWAKRAWARAGKVPPGDITPRVLEDLALQGDPVAKKTWARAADALGSALANLVNIFNPEVILLTGGVAGGAPLFLPRALQVMRENAFETPGRAVKVKVSRHRSDLGVMGAALLVP